jgi:hypothetical protein
MEISADISTDPSGPGGDGERDRARSQSGSTSWAGDRGVLSGEGARRRSREAVARPKLVQFTLTLEEFDEVSQTAEQAGMARGAYAADVTLAAARGVPDRTGSPLREVLGERMAAAGLVRRIGINLNRAVAKLNATGQRGEDLPPSAQFCARVVQRLDEAAEQVRRSIP